jgi:hypothetical protein
MNIGNVNTGQNNSSVNSNSNNNNNSSISEQLWGVRSSSRIGNPTVPASSNAPANQNATNRNSLSFGGSNLANNNNLNINNNNNSGSNSSNNNQNSILNQQFFRSNSWNVNSQQQGVNNNNNSNTNNSNNNGSNNTIFNPLNGSLNGGFFILIRGVTPQIDQSTLRALCAQHASGPLTYYRYITQMTCVIVRYNSKEESNNALTKLNGVLLGNTTIFTQSLSENELKFLFTL